LNFIENYNDLHIRVIGGIAFPLYRIDNNLNFLLSDSSELAELLSSQRYLFRVLEIKAFQENQFLCSPLSSSVNADEKIPPLHSHSRFPVMIFLRSYFI